MLTHLPCSSSVHLPSPPTRVAAGESAACAADRPWSSPSVVLTPAWAKSGLPSGAMDGYVEIRVGEGGSEHGGVGDGTPVCEGGGDEGELDGGDDSVTGNIVTGGHETDGQASQGYLLGWRDDGCQGGACGGHVWCLVWAGWVVDM